MTDTAINEALALKVLNLVDKGLVKGLGENKPGGMCVEAAVCVAMGLPFGDAPRCVNDVVRRFKIALNDCEWSSTSARAEGMRALAIAQLGTDTWSDAQESSFRATVRDMTVWKLLPCAFEFFHASRFIGSLVNTVFKETIAAIHNADSVKAAIDRVYSVFNSYESCVARDTNYHPAWNRYYTLLYALRRLKLANGPQISMDLLAKTASDLASIAGGRDDFLKVSAAIALYAIKEIGSPGCEYLYLLDSPKT